MPDNSRWEELLAVMARLRGPGGCPWDREQTAETLKKYVIEEAYEVAEAIERGDPGHLAEELGDLLLQIVFQAQVASEAGLFDIDDVVRGITGKLVRRHPHVFGGAEAAGPEDVLRNWELIKKSEGRRESLFEGIPSALPALRRAARVQQRAATVGFDWREAAPVLAKLKEEVAELEAAMASGDLEHAARELGDILFAAANLGRHVGAEAEDALNGAVDRFIRRFRHVERTLEARGSSPAESSLEEMDSLWDEAKGREDQGELL